MTEDAATVEAPAGPRRRPRHTDDAVFEAAAAAFARDVAKRAPEYLDGASVEEFKRHLACVLPVVNDDGTDLAKALETRYGYQYDAEAVELMGGWGQELRSARDAAIKAWVAEVRPEPPFEGIVRVRTDLPRMTGEGVAYRDVHSDERAECVFIPDADRQRFVRDGAFTGGYVVAWETVTVVGAASEEDRAALKAKGEIHVRMARESARQALDARIRRAFETAVGAACARLREQITSDLRQAHVAAARAIAEAGPDLDPFGETAVEAAAILKLLQGRASRERFEAENPPAPEPADAGA